MPSLTVVVPALNEEDNLRPAVEAVLKELGPLADPLEVLVFDDASTDRTGEVADALAREDGRVRVFHNARRLNIGGIYKAGVREARGEYLVLVPGDNEARVDEVARALRDAGEAQMVILYVTNPEVRGRWRRSLSLAYVGLVNLLLGTRLRYTNGTNILRTAVVRAIPIRTDGFSYQTEVLVKAVRSGVGYVEVGVALQRRASGRSKALSWRNVRSVLAGLARLWWDVNVRERHRYRRRGSVVQRRA